MKKCSFTVLPRRVTVEDDAYRDSPPAMTEEGVDVGKGRKGIFKKKSTSSSITSAIKKAPSISSVYDDQQEVFVGWRTFCCRLLHEHWHIQVHITQTNDLIFTYWCLSKYFVLLFILYLVRTHQVFRVLFRAIVVAIIKWWLLSPQNKTISPLMPIQRVEKCLSLVSIPLYKLSCNIYLGSSK